MANLIGQSCLSRLYIPLTAVGITAIFGGLWFLMAGILPPWSDESSQLAAARGIFLTGRPFSVDFSQCAQLTPHQYIRSLELSQLMAWSYGIFGESLRAARTVPFVFTIGTWLLYIVYTRWRGYSSGRQILVATVLFFGQSIALEKALYTRIYAPLLFFLLLALIAAWESVNFWRLKKIPHAAGWLVIVVLSLYVTRHWHLLQFATFFLSIILLWMATYRLPVRDFLRQQWRRVDSLPVRRRYPAIVLLLLLAAVTITIGPRVVDGIGSELVGLPSVFGFGRRYHSLIMVIPWDNIVGLIRFLLVTNVLLIVWWRISKSEGSGRDFNSWLLSTGILSGLCVAFLMNHSFVFYSRYFYLAVGLIALGSSRRVADLPNRYFLGAVLSVYLAVNGVMSGVNFYFDRNNISTAIDWLEINAGEDDLMLSNGVNLYFNGGVPLCGRTVTVNRRPPLVASVDDLKDVPLETDRTRYLRAQPWPGSDRMSAESLRGLLDKNPSSNVYYLFNYTYEFRDNLYRWTTGKERQNRTDIDYLLSTGDVGQKLDLGSRNSGLKLIDRKKLLAALEKRDLP